MKSEQILDLAEASLRTWDVIVIGGGMGGGTSAHALAMAGHKVLLVEKGRQRSEDASVGIQFEQTDPQDRLNNGKWPQQLSANVDGSPSNIWAPLGCGLGGSSLLYAATLHRLEPRDFSPQTHPQGEELSWPIAYENLQPYYERAESLYAVKGANDPLASHSSTSLGPPRAMCERDAHFFRSFKAAGLSPFRQHVAAEYDVDKAKTGEPISAQEIRRDSFNSAILPAVNSGKLFVVIEAEVEMISADTKTVHSISIKKGEQTFELQAAIFVLSAGAYMSPVILQRSKNKDWPQGLANSSGLVGKNLMFHASDFIAFWPREKNLPPGSYKAVALRDHYFVEGKKYGEFQSTGLSADYGIVLYALRLLFDQSPFRRLSPLRHLLRIPAYLAAKLYGEATIFTTIVEDFPYPENRVFVDEEAPSRMRFEYHIHDEFRERVNTMNKNLRKNLSRLRSLPMTIGVSLNFGHPCGTCKAGDDKRTSVVDKNCKAHDLDNLYIVDSSFMPTSGGTNPSLTIAANALRVADLISERIQTSSAPEG